MGANLQESRDLAQIQALINQMNQVGPFGSMTFSGPVDQKGRRDPTQTTATTTLSPELQAVFSTLFGNQAAFGQAAGNMLSGMNLGGRVSGVNPADFQAPNRPVGQFRAPNNRIGEFQAPGTEIDPFRRPNFGPASSPGINNPFNLLNVLPGGVNENTFGEERSRVEQATFDRAMGLLDPAWQQQDRRREQDLANRGLPISGEAYQTDRANTMRGRGETLNRLAMESVLAGGQEQSRLLGDLLGTSQAGVGQAMANRGQRFGEALSGYGANLQGQGQQFGQALSGYGANLQGQGQQFGQALQGFGANLGAQGQQFGQALQGFGANLQGAQFDLSRALANRQVPLQELMSLFGASSSAQQPNFFAPGQTQVQNMATPGQGSFMQQMMPGLINAGATLGGAWLLSDRRIKTDIKRIGETDDGLPIYTFRYLGSDGPVQMGVIAQEVLRTKPKAVTVTTSGFLAVDYGQL